MRTDTTKINKIALHKVGNKLSDDGIFLSKKCLNTDEEIEEILATYFLSSFRTPEYYTFFHETDLGLNEVYTYVSSIFDDIGGFYQQSVNLAKHLYEKSDHPKIKGGEFYVVHFHDCKIEGDVVEAVGIFKSENRDVFLKIFPSEENLEIESEKGINVCKLDKGCLIFNVERENGYVVAVVDNTNKGMEAHYWMDEFLHIRQRQDEYYNTQNVLSLCKNFVTKELPQQFELSKADQADFLNKSVKFFKEKEEFDMEEFTQTVIAQPELIDSFQQYKDDFQKERDVEIFDHFNISDSAVKKQARIFKGVIKLDKNFHIYVHGNNEYIKKGFDEESGMNFYQLFFKSEQ